MNKRNWKVFVFIFLFLSLVLNGFDSNASKQRADEEKDVFIKEQDQIVGTWKSRKTYYRPNERWIKEYITCFSPDGQVIHYGNRNEDRGIWERVDEHTVKVVYNNCTYEAVGGGTIRLPKYSCLYIYDEKNKTLSRSTDRQSSFYVKLGEEKDREYVVTDFDDYTEPLYFESEACEIEEYYDHFPEGFWYDETLEKALLEISGELSRGEEAQLERADVPFSLESVVLYDITGDGKEEIFALVRPREHNWLKNASEGNFYIISPKSNGGYTILAKNSEILGGYTEILASDGTSLLPTQGYSSSSSWKGGHRLHISYRKDQVLVDREERYSFHWDYPVINYVQDYKEGKFFVYVARNPGQGETEGYGSYIEIEKSIKIDEETFEPLYLPFTGYNRNSHEYPSVYRAFSPFDEGWWQDGGSYPEDETAYGRRADWIETAADDDPNQMLKEAVEKSGLILEKKAYPWTAETKKNVESILRCPVADYYYISDYDAAVYACGEIRFFKKEIISEDGYLEEWVPVTAF